MYISKKVINSILKVPFAAYNTRQYCFIFLHKNERDIYKGKKKTFEFKSTVVINVVIFPGEVECWCKVV